MSKPTLILAVLVAVIALVMLLAPQYLLNPLVVLSLLAACWAWQADAAMRRIETRRSGVDGTAGNTPPIHPGCERGI